MEVEQHEYISNYLLGELDEDETRDLEEHYFSCDDCFESLKDALALRSALAEEHRAAVAWRSPVMNTWAWVGLAAAVIVLIGLAVVLLPRMQQQADDTRLEIDRLAAIEAPPYAPRTLRGAEGEAERLFRDAMALYQEGDYAAAIPGLEAAAGLDAESERISFYLGACYMMEGRPAPAVESFDRVVASEGSPYFERAIFYRAKAFLKLGRLEEAREELEGVVSLGGELEAEAQQILGRLPY